jgi:hypothetical protein
MGDMVEGEPGCDDAPDADLSDESKRSGPLLIFLSILVKTARQNKDVLRESPRQAPFCR